MTNGMDEKDNKRRIIERVIQRARNGTDRDVDIVNDCYDEWQDDDRRTTTVTMTPRGLKNLDGVYVSPQGDSISGSAIRGTGERGND